jgi:alpha-L-glutamate ligase-like protein
VDDKLRMQTLCGKIGVPTPEVYTSVRSYSQLRDLPRLLCGQADFVIKPNRGSAGRGVLVVVGKAGNDYQRHNGDRLGLDQLRQHLSDVLSGMYSLGGQPDHAIVQQRVRLHPAFAPVAYKGIPDIRVILYRNEPAMAMLRLPTRASNGRANLHQGGIGTGVDLDTGITNHAVLRNRFVECHPDTGVAVVGVQVPFWPEVLDMSRRVAREVGLGYLGVDIVVDAAAGPMLLEANARPGLAIQIANHRGLLPRLREIDDLAPAQGLHAAPEWVELEEPIIIGRIGPRERKSA